jgi:heterogeneous nuclear ribonucleoprotein F/H
MPVVKLRGLPWSCTIEDIIKFLEPIKIVFKKIEIEDISSDVSNLSSTPSVYLTTNTEGRPSGEAFIEVEEETDVDTALLKNNNLMGQRYIEVFKSNYDQLSKHIEESRNRTLNWSDPVVRLRGLPYGCTETDIKNFFNGEYIEYIFFGLYYTINEVLGFLKLI